VAKTGQFCLWQRQGRGNIRLQIALLPIFMSIKIFPDRCGLEGYKLVWDADLFWRGSCLLLHQISMNACLKKRKADCMARLFPRPLVLLLACSSVLLAGCQHPIPPSGAGPQDAPAPHPFIDARSFPQPAVPTAPCVVKVSLEKVPDSKDESLVASGKEPGSASVQLGDDFAHILKILRDR
jgi:hypothetical protein